MSADLLDFGSFDETPITTKPNTSSSNSFFSSAGSTAETSTQPTGFQSWQTPSATKPVDDIWGDMITLQPAGTSKPPVPQSNDSWSSFGATGATTQNTIKPAPSVYGGSSSAVMNAPKQSSKPEVLRRPTVDLFSSNAFSVGPSKSAPLPAERPPTKQQSSHGEVLFDAEEDGVFDDDDFGDFESVTPAPPPKEPATIKVPQNARPLDKTLASITLSSPTKETTADPQASKLPSLQEHNPFADLGFSDRQVAKPRIEKQNTSTPPTAWPTFEPQAGNKSSGRGSLILDDGLDESWGNFGDLPLETPPVPSQASIDEDAEFEADAWGWDSVDTVTKVLTAPKAVIAPKKLPARIDMSPPANIPPPSVLLTLFPPLFDLPQSALFKPVSNQAYSLKNRIMSDPKAVEFLRAYLLIAIVAARIITGRKLRWKRDPLLSQAMKIGPSVAGGGGGMKLAGVDKAEVTREDREVTEVARLWKEQIGKLRSAIAVANSGMHDSSQHLAIPDVSEGMHVKTLVGGLTAPKPCVVCGLKREERVNKVDVDVEDSFGEWWVEHWGHRACRNFWLEHEKTLSQRR